MIRGIIFDCFGVLYIDASRHFYETYMPNYETLRPQLRELNRAYDIGYLSQQQLNVAVAELADLPLPLVTAHIQGLHQRNQVLLDYAQSLRGRYAVGMLSNIGHGGMESFFSAKEQQTLFDQVVLSADVGIVKPSPEIFELMAERMALSPEQCVMIDDIADNVAGAQQAGMQGIVYQSNEQLIATLDGLLTT